MTHVLIMMWLMQSGPVTITADFATFEACGAASHALQNQMAEEKDNRNYPQSLQYRLVLNTCIPKDKQAK